MKRKNWVDLKSYFTAFSFLALNGGGQFAFPGGVFG
jgi:hypothetical protein